jgi:hypothetical protein
MKWLTKKQFNQIDLTTALVGGIVIANHEYVAFLIAVLVGGAISIIAELCCAAQRG